MISPSQKPLPDNAQHLQQTNIHSPRWDSNPQSQQASGRGPTAETARPLGPASPEVYSIYNFITDFKMGLDSVVVKALRYLSDGPVIDSRWCHWIFQRHISFRPYHSTGVDSAPSENEYQELSWEQTRLVREADKPHHLHVPNVMKSGSLNLLEPSGPHRACYGTPFTPGIWQ